MSFSTYATPQVYTEPVSDKILEPSPDHMEKTPTERIAPPVRPLLRDYLDKTISEAFEMAKPDSSTTLAYYISFLLIAIVGIVYVYMFFGNFFKRKY